MFHFPISGVETYWWLPVVVAFCISSVTSTAGITGAFLILPFQVSVLGFTGPAVSSTNLIFNIAASPGGIIKFIRDKRIVWSLTLTTICGIMPGFILGAIIRILYLPDPHPFKLFVALVLLFVGIRLGLDTFKKPIFRDGIKAEQDTLIISKSTLDFKYIKYYINGTEYKTPTRPILAFCLIVGIVSGIYGIGGGALLAPFLVAVYRQPIKVISGVALISTFTVSVLGIVVYALLALIYADTGLSITPDWLLGLLFGLGGLIGIYTGVALQKYVPVRVIKMILLGCIGVIVVRYIMEFFAVLNG